MSSLLDKLKALVSANVRGPRRYNKEPEAPAGTAEEPTSVPEVTEAPAQRRQVPEVTEAPQAAQDSARTTVPTSTAASRVKESEKDADQAGALEEERIVDLLKGQES
jgi:hypothetical protein